MKIHYALVSFLFLSTLFISCKKEKDPTIASPSATPAPVVFTANVNFVDEGGASFTMNGVSGFDLNSPPTLATSGDLTQDSILRLYFEDESTHTDFSLILGESGGDIIQPGTYSFTSPGTDYQFSMQMINKQSDIHYLYGNILNNLGLQYNGQAIVSNGTLTITSLSQTSISGTLNAELYYAAVSAINKTHKVTINNGSFTCDIVRY